MSLILFGFKGCGKTHFGKLLSHALKCPFIDTDDLVVETYEKQYGRKLEIRRIHQTLGENGFRTLEKEVIHQLKGENGVVIALGGGSILDPSNIFHLQKIGRLIYLKSSFERVKERILEHGIPSFIDTINPIESLYAVYQERRSLYETIQAQSIDLDLLNEEEVLRVLGDNHGL